MKLNVGCGADAWGDVRVDMTRDYWMCEGKSTANVIADCQHLPFRDKAFEETRCREVLEHVPNWETALLELARVTIDRIELTFPVDSYLPHTDWCLPLHGLDRRNLRFFFMLPKRTREHLWQLNPRLVEKILAGKGFRVTQEQTHTYIIGVLTYGRKGLLLNKFQFFQVLNSKFRQPRSWKMIALKH